MSLPAHDLIQQLVRLAAAGKDLMSALLAPQDVRLLRVCAVSRRFDQAVFERVIRPAAESIGAVSSFEQLVALPSVRADAGRSGWYGIEAVERARLLDDRADAELEGSAAAGSLDARALRRLNRRLAAWFRLLGPDGELESLYHRLACASPAAEATWRKRYEAARDRFDLARCESLLSLLNDPAIVVTPTFMDEARKQRGLLTGRGAFSDDYFRTSRYLERDDLVTAFEKLLGDDERFILMLHAPGGSGKTMFLRWLAARYCMPRDIPIARVDFDFLDESENNLAPAFFIGKLAERLNAQLPNAPFFELLRDLAEVRRQAAGRLATGARAGSAEAARKLEAEVRHRFAASLAESCPGRAVVLVFDTLEDAALKHQVNMLAVVKAIDEVRELARRDVPAHRATRIVLILSGRYPVDEKHFPQVHAKYHGRMLSSLVPPFDARESRAYLGKRLAGISTEPADEVIQGVVTRARGIPFKLALYADVLLATPTIGVAELGRGLDVDLLYLVERVLKRIPDERLKWLLRYGVLSRRLTRSFIEKVLAAPMLRALSGDHATDNPADDKVELKSWKPLWRVAPGRAQAAAIDFDGLWKLLREYAGASSWVSIDTQVGDSVSIQPVVSQPMRRALLSRDRSVVEEIHRAAIRYAQRSASADSSPAARMEMLTYHDFQLNGPAAAAAWRRRLDKAAGDLALVRGLASVVLSEDLGEGDPETGEENKAAPLVPDSVRARARFALAAAELTQSQLPGFEDHRDRLLDEARSALAAYDRIAASTTGRAVGLADEAILRFDLALDAAQQQSAVAQMTQALATRLSAEARSRLLRYLEYAHSRSDPALAVSYARKRGAIAFRRGDVRGYAEYVVATLKEELRTGASKAALRNFLIAREEFSASSSRWRSHEDASQFRHVLMSEQRIFDASCGLYAQGLKRRRVETVGPATLDSIAMGIEVRVWEAELLLFADEPQAAMTLAASQGRDVAAQAGAAPQRRLPAEQLQGWSARCLDVRAHAARRLFDHGAALDHFQSLMTLRAQAGDHEGELDARLSKGSLQMIDIGNLVQAAEHLLDHDDALPDASADLRLKHCMLRAALHDRRGDGDGAVRLLDEAARLPPTLKMPPPLAPVFIALAGLNFNSVADRSPFLQALADAMASFDYVGARLAMLHSLSYCTPVPDVPKKLVDRIERMTRIVALGVPGYKRLAGADRIRMVANRVELLRVIGLRARAARELSALRSFSAQLAQPAVRQRHLALACQRLDLDPRLLLGHTWLPRFLTAFKRFRSLCAAVQVEAAERALHAGKPADARRLLRSGLRELDRPESVRSLVDIRALQLQARLVTLEAGPGAAADAAEALQRANRIRNQLGLAPATTPTPTLTPTVAVPATALAPEPPTDAPDRADPAARAPAPSRSMWLSPSSSLCVRIAQPGVAGGFEIGFGRGESAHEQWAIKEPCVQLLSQFSSSRFGEGTGQEALLRLRHSPLDFGSWLSRSMLPSGMRDRLLELNPKVAGAAPGPGLSIEAAQPGMHAVPWELMVVDGALRPTPLSRDQRLSELWRAPFNVGARHRTAWVQRALQVLLGRRITSDGEFGPATAAALQSWQADAGMAESGIADDATMAALQEHLARRAGPAPSPEPFSVLVVRPNRAAEAGSQRGFQASGTDLVDLYVQRGVEVASVEEPSIDLLRQALRQRPWSAIHISAPVSQSRSSLELTLQFASDYKHSGTSAFGASLLARLFAERPANTALPMVIVDAPHPHLLDETLRQLFCRNAFAAQLFEFGRFPAVIATGLAAPEEQRVLSECLTRSIKAQPSPGALTRALRSCLGPVGDADNVSAQVATAGIALFTSDPAIEPRWRTLPGLAHA